MKTYVFDTINRYKRFSETLDVKTAICNKSWWVFNDSGEKELYIFQEDGTLYVTYSGNVNHGTWKYIPANKSIIISAGEQSYMVHAAFMDSTIFALQVDGTEQYAFLIDEQNKQHFLPNSFSEIKNYFFAKEQKLIKQQQYEQYANRVNEEHERRQIEIEELKQQAQFVHQTISLETSCLGSTGWSFRYVFIPYLIFSILLLATGAISDKVVLLLLFPGSLIVFFIAAFIYSSITRPAKEDKLLEEWKEKHPNDPVIDYL